MPVASHLPGNQRVFSNALVVSEASQRSRFAFLFYFYNKNIILIKNCSCCHCSDAEDMPRHQPPLPIVTTSGATVTQPQFGHGPVRHRPPADKPGQSGKTVTVKAVCRSDIQGQRGGAGTVCPLFLMFYYFWSCSSLSSGNCATLDFLPGCGESECVE